MVDNKSKTSLIEHIHKNMYKCLCVLWEVFLLSMLIYKASVIMILLTL